MPARVTLLIHGDLDGMVCGILLLRAAGPDAAIVIANGRTLAKELGALAGAPGLPENIYVADIPLLADLSQHVLSLATAISKRGGQIHIYDHHHGWGAAPAEAFATLAVDTSKTTAAAIVYRELLAGDSIAGHWLAVLSEKDKSADPVVARHFGLLVALMQRQHWNHTDLVLRCLASGGRLSPEQERLADWYFQVHVPKEQKVAATAELLTTATGRKIAWIDLRAYKEHLSVSRHAIEMHGADLVASVLRDAILLGGRSIDRGIDLSFLHGEHIVDGHSFSIAGHKSPVRISPNDRTVKEGFLVMVRRFIVARL